VPCHREEPNNEFLFVDLESNVIGASSLSHFRADLIILFEIRLNGVVEQA
jgi:hypothetical protein